MHKVRNLACWILLFAATSSFAGWSSSKWKVRWMNPKISKMANGVGDSVYVVRFYPDSTATSSSGTICGKPSTTEILLRTSDTSSTAMLQVKSWQAALLVALGGNRSVRVDWDGSHCYANNIILCSDASTCPIP
jgi:hypothetical protein